MEQKKPLSSDFKRDPFVVFREVQEDICNKVLNQSNQITKFEFKSFDKSNDIIFGNFVEINVMNTLKNTCIQCNIKDIDMVMNKFWDIYQRDFRLNLGYIYNYGTYVTEFTIPAIAASLASCLYTILIGDNNYEAKYQAINLFYCVMISVLNTILNGNCKEYKNSIAGILSRAIIRDEEIE